MRSYVFLHLIGAGLIVLILCSCQDLKKIEAVELKAEFAFPLIDTEVSMDLLLDHWSEQPEWFQVEPDGLMKIVYPLSLYDSIVGDYLSVEDIEADIFLEEGWVPTDLFGFGPLESALVKEGQIRFTTELPRAGNFQFSLTFPGGVGERQEPLNYVHRFSGDRYQLPEEDGFSLAGVPMNFSDGFLAYSYSITDVQSGERIQPRNLRFSFEGLSFSYAIGEFELGEVIQDNVQVDLDLPDFSSDAKLEFSEPSLQLRLTHSLGIPLTVQLSPFEARKESEVLTVQSPLSNPFTLTYPSLSERGESKTTELVFNRDNSDLPALISFFPEQLIFGWRFGRGEEDGPFFLTDSLRVGVQGSLEVPLILKASQVHYSQPLDNLPEWPEVPILSEVKVKLFADNGLPIELRGQLYFWDGNGQLIDSLFSDTPLWLPAASVNENGEVSASSSSEQVVSMDADRYERLRQSQRAELQLGAATTDNGEKAVRFTTQQKLRLRLGLRSELDPQFD